MGYVMAKYLRLSMDEDRAESQSISSQRMILDRFISQMGRGDVEVLEFVDNGHSGTNFERPAVQELLELVRAGKIDCIIVKDFSRFGRNLIDTGYFIEQVFPLYRVRFIALGDNYDSAESADGSGEPFLAFKFLINEMYSRDLSKKIRGAKAVRAARGEAVTRNCAFGYRLDNARRMVIDPPAADTVRLIFKLALEGKGLEEIKGRLYAENRPTPAVYKGHRSNGDQTFSSLWSSASIKKILADEQYTGTYIAGRTTGLEVGHKARLSVDESRWIRIPDHHPAIISREDFIAVRKMRPHRRYNRKPASSNGHAAVSPLGGKVVCGCCNHVMTFRGQGQAAFLCRFTRPAPDAPCHKLVVPECELVEAVFTAMRRQVRSFALERDGACEGTRSDHAQPDEHDIGYFYERLKAGEIDVSTFRERSKAIRAKRKTREAAPVAVGQISDHAVIRMVEQAEELTQELADAVIDRVLVYPDGGVRIRWKLDVLQDEVIAVEL